MENNQLFYLMQLAGGTFPSGGFSQSWGLETYVSQGKITDSTSFLKFLDTYLDSTIGKCEGPLLSAAYAIAKEWNIEDIRELEDLSRAVKVTRESREAALRMGKAFLRIMADILEKRELLDLKEGYQREGITYPVIYGLICGTLELGLKSAMEAFVFSTVNALVQSAVKLIPLGNTQAQKVLLDAQPMMEKAVTDGITLPLDEISNFSPGLDIASILHETLPVRLYMS